MKPPAHSLGIALGSGAARGLAHIGVLKALARHGITPDVVAGTSMGAMIGALYCLNPDPAALEDTTTRLTAQNWLKFIAPGLPIHGLISTKRLDSFLAQLFGNHTFADTAIPFHCVATDMHNECAVTFSSGLLKRAVRASIAVPVFIPPCHYQRRYYIDGAITNPVPVDVLTALGATITIAVNVMPPMRHNTNRPCRTTAAKGPFVLTLLDALFDKKSTGKRAKHPADPSLLDTFLAALEIMQQQITASRFTIYPPDLTIQVDTAAFRLYEFHRADELIAAGVDAAEKAMPQLRALLDGTKKGKQHGILSMR